MARKGALLAALVVVLAGGLCYLYLAARGRGEGPAGQGGADDVLARHRGGTLVLLLGMPGCPGTARATAFLTAYAAEKPDDVALVRLDVPPPGGKLGEISWSAPFPRETDPERAVASRLDFFFYPTLYILDREGQVRFAGGCDPESVKRMVAEIRAEKPGSPKQVYTPPLPAVGTPAEEFNAATAGGGTTSLRDLRGGKATLLFFGSTACPFSTAAAAQLPGLVAEFKGAGASFAVIDAGPDAEAIREFYAGAAPGVPVLLDTDRKISGGAYAVQAVPFFYVIDASGRIVDRRPFTPEAARAALGGALGLAASPGKGPQPGAG